MDEPSLTERLAIELETPRGGIIEDSRARYNHQMAHPDDSAVDLALSARERGSLAPTKYWSVVASSGRLRCELCPRGCSLREGQRGFVRARQDDEIVLTTYGRSSGFCVDPIEKKPLNHFLPGTAVLSFGTAGCNLACTFCQNWDISKSREMDTLADYASPQRIAERALEAGCRSVAFTYNDPVIFMEYAVDVAQACHELDIKTVAVTAGYICAEPRAAFFEHIDAANVDLKAFSEQFYAKHAKGHLQPVLDTLVYLARETNVWFELTTLLIPGLNDSDAELEQLTAWVVENLGPDVPLHFSAFHPAYQMHDRPRTEGASLSRARRVALEAGVRYAYTGNVHDPRGGSTSCHKCDALLIERDWYELGAWGLSNSGACLACGHVCAGVFDGRPGRWGRRRLPLSMA